MKELNNLNTKLILMKLKFLSRQMKINDDKKNKENS